MPGSVRLRGGQGTTDRRLDRLVSETTEHLDRYPLTAATVPDDRTGVVIGVNWYSDYSRPEQGRDKRWRVKLTSSSRVIGGHAIYLPEKGFSDARSWYAYYNQRSEGRCVQFATSRLLSHLNRRRYEIRPDHPAGRWLYHRAQEIDEWDGGSYPGASPVYEGTSVRAALEVVREKGAVRRGHDGPAYGDGIVVYRWGVDLADILRVLGRENDSEIPHLNSWGTSYPRVVWAPVEDHARLRAEDGEYGVVTDR